MGIILDIYFINYKNGIDALIDYVNNSTNSLKQLQELTLSAYKNGVFNTVKAVLNKKEITVEKLGVNSLEDIINTNNGLDRFTKWLIKYIGFNKLDVFSKNVDLNASLLKIKEDIKNNNSIVEKLIDNIFVFNIISRYTFEAGKREGYGKSIFNMVMLASLSILSSVGFDIWKTVKTRELSVDNSLKHIPFGKDVKKIVEVGERG